MPHPIPASLAEWQAAWRTSQRGNPWMKLGTDGYVIFPAQGRPPGWVARVGRSILDGYRWPDVEAAKVGLYDLVVGLSADQLAELHGPPQDDRDRPARPEADRERPPSGPPPEDDGERLATFPRTGGREEMRVSLREFEGREFIALRVWMRDDRTGAWWPTRKGCSVRLRELPGMLAALQRAAELVSPASGQAVAAPSDRRDYGSLPPLTGGRPDFDECRRDG
jgi:Transcriptional Coactivator p15 (PC4)